MATTKPNVIRDSGLEAANGVLTIRRVYVVTDMDPTSTMILTDALKAPDIPYAGQPHPVYRFAIARKFQVNPIIANGKAFSTSAEVVVTYESQAPQGGTPYAIEFGSTLNQVETDTTNDGKEIEVFWSGNVIAAGKPDQVGKKIGMRGIIPKYVRQDTITYTTWIVTIQSTLDYPTPIESLKEKYLGKVNSVPFRGGAKHDWMCVVCDGSTEDFGKSYMVTIRLEKKPTPDKRQGGWDEWAWYRLENGDIPFGVSKKIPDGVKLITNLYDEVDFSHIGDDLVALRSI